LNKQQSIKNNYTGGRRRNLKYKNYKDGSRKIGKKVDLSVDNSNLELYSRTQWRDFQKYYTDDTDIM
jgi:hypothetical protein